MNYIKLIYLRWRVGFLAAQWEHAVQLSETYREEAETYQKEMKKAQRALFMAQPVREITQ
jgi:hypothetical protein